jgi:maltose O-acetyltransferase
LSIKLSRLRHVIVEELGGLKLRLFLVKIFLGFFPIYGGGRIRAQVLKLAGFQIGQKCVFMDLPTITGTGDLYHRLIVGDNGFFNIGCFFDLAAVITIEDGVTIGPEVMLITGAHEIGYLERRAGPLTPRPIKLCKGVWLGARCVVLPGITIGEGSIVGAGAIVTKDVPANVVVAGIPAKVIQRL